MPKASKKQAKPKKEEGVGCFIDKNVVWTWRMHEGHRCKLCDSPLYVYEKVIRNTKTGAECKDAPVALLEPLNTPEIAEYKREDAALVLRANNYICHSCLDVLQCLIESTHHRHCRHDDSCTRCCNFDPGDD